MKELGKIIRNRDNCKFYGAKRYPPHLNTDDKGDNDDPCLEGTQNA